MSSSLAFCFSFMVTLCCAVEYPYNLSLQQDKYTAYWNYDNETDKFFFKVEVKNVSGWIAFGVSRLLFPADPDRQWNFNMMEYYDILVGGIYDNRTNYFKDCLTDGYKRPKCDESQDWHVTSLTENDGMTTMEFYRLRNTSDAEGDNVIGPGERRIVWAYNDTSDFIGDNWPKDSENGFVEIELLKEPKPPAIIEVMGRTRAKSSGVGNLPLNVFFFLFFVCSLSIL
ncbi:DBH-like monooxygenase protein 2 homolog [Acropora millepora]|uniref:DBH-like monooxygenase protein 2 homolog n=1 Tax=Acropora millepora TaxID=45264 RepID=UPI001CF3F756|nr:DBH-like monooxygenase protein 2 homolog [Acropora millepora]